MTRKPELSAKSLASIAAGLVLFLSTPVGAETLAQTGLYTPNGVPQSPPLRVEVLDGTRFRDIETQTVYRLYGIDTCAPGQTARLGRQPWPCGTMAAAWLVTATLDKWLACTTLREVDGEHWARCASADHPDLGADMIREGVAVTSPPTEQSPGVRAYGIAERDARKAYRGLWASAFQMPWDYRATSGHRAVATTSGEVAP